MHCKFVKLSSVLQIDKELGEDIYFYKEGNGKWTLSIYKPLKWGIAGTAQIAEDVVSICHTPQFYIANSLSCL